MSDRRVAEHSALIDTAITLDRHPDEGPPPSDRPSVDLPVQRGAPVSSAPATVPR
jgi:hypothetical protein